MARLGAQAAAVALFFINLYNSADHVRIVLSELILRSEHTILKSNCMLEIQQDTEGNRGKGEKYELRAV